MRAFFLFGVLCSTLLIVARAEWDPKEEECVKELHLDKELMQAFDKEPSSPDYNVEYNKFLECSWKKKGIVHEDGKIDWDKVDDLLLAEFQKCFDEAPKMGEFVSAPIIRAIVDLCRERTGSTTGKTIAKVKNCAALKVLELADGTFKLVLQPSLSSDV